MFEIDFYEKKGKSEVRDFLEGLRIRVSKSKDARIQYEQVTTYIQLLAENGTKGLPISIAEHLEDGIWELRPGNNRVFFFYYDIGGRYVLLHHMRKKTQKTPRREIKQAKKEREDYIEQKEDESNDMGRLQERS